MKLQLPAIMNSIDTSHSPEHGMLAVKGIAGGMINMFGFIASFQQELEAWLRITSLVVGIAVGVLTFISIWRKMRK
jgi:hypothetical protein